MIRRLPVLHAEITAPGDVVRCEIFATDLTAQGCADRSLARLVRPGRKQPRPGERAARYVRCARCELGAVARTRLDVRGVPGVPETLVLPDPDGGALPPPPRVPPRALTDREETFLAAQGWTRDGARWLDQHGTPFAPHSALELAKRERWSYIPQNIGSGRRSATDQAVVVSKSRAA